MFSRCVVAILGSPPSPLIFTPVPTSQWFWFPFWFRTTEFPSVISFSIPNSSPIIAVYLPEKILV
jgi:hypothetical protein